MVSIYFISLSLLYEKTGISWSLVLHSLHLELPNSAVQQRWGCHISVCPGLAGGPDLWLPQNLTPWGWGFPGAVMEGDWGSSLCDWVVSILSVFFCMCRNELFMFSKTCVWFLLVLFKKQILFLHHNWALVFQLYSFGFSLFHIGVRKKKKEETFFGDKGRDYTIFTVASDSSVL